MALAVLASALAVQAASAEEGLNGIIRAYEQAAPAVQGFASERAELQQVQAGAETSIVGRWRSDETGNIIRLEETGGVVGGVIDTIANPDVLHPALQRVGAQVVRGMRAAGSGKWTGGQVMKSEENSWYKGSAYLENGKLRLEGCISIFLIGDQCKSKEYTRIP